MFSFFKKNKRRKSIIQKQFSGFQNEFNKNQKAAIVLSLGMIAKSDGVNQNELDYISSTMELLDIDEDDPIFEDLTQKGPENLVTKLNSIEKSQKEWYIVAVHGLISCDGKISKREADYAINFCQRIGISEDEYISIVKKSNALQEKFLGNQ